MEMMQFLCDTDFLFEYIGGNEEVLDFLKDPPIIFTSVITFSEMILACTNKRDAVRLNKIFANGFAVLPIEREISDLHLQLLNNYHLSHSLKLNDAFIAATALFYDLPLATCNSKDFKYIGNLKLVQHSIKPKRKGGGLFDSFS